MVAGLGLPVAGGVAGVAVGVAAGVAGCDAARDAASDAGGLRAGGFGPVIVRLVYRFGKRLRVRAAVVLGRAGF